MSKINRILYLDYDGCLHHEQVFFHPRHGIYMNTPGRSLFEWMPILDELLRPHPDVSIVLSTSWVRAKNFSFARKQLSPALRERVIGATFHSRFMHNEAFARLPRGVQIEDDVARRAPQSWLAIDDDAMGWPDWCRNNLVQTDGNCGISDPAVQDAIRKMLGSF